MSDEAAGKADAGLHERGRELDEAFYPEGGEDGLIEQLRLRLKEESAKEEIASASGISDPEVLSHLASLGIRADTLAALTLIPLIEVAWADGVMESREREAVLSAAVATGLRRGSPSFELLRIWVADEPPEDMRKAWREFVGALCRELDGEEVARFKQNLLARTREVAEAAGDILGDGSRVSPEEKAVFAELEEAFAVQARVG